MKTLSTFIYAFQGIKHCYKNEFNFRNHLYLMSAVFLLSILFSINKTEWILVILCCLIVIITEIINTAIENICNLISKDFHPLIKNIKDISAAAVLISAIGSCIIGVLIFLPKILN